ncbi:cell cycle control protein cwf8 [Microthyrium microscopicum]|uniref:Pre-mRNA-processing factor 19 n=1 Tax=Microthyrium microscopicum TaxID=703497 RepID=A0A6A6U4R2_9PEZI|nr:cell cycle control protein cwf8 [Microthyrium microscopicum]
MLCAISGEPPQVPVASRKNGNIFEKRLIEAYITDNGTDPVTGEELTVEDLIDLKSSRIVNPRPPTQTSIPALLSTFQNEWDALAVESYQLKKQLAQTRQELSTALYDYEGAIRLLARVTQERDDARAALAKVQVGGAVNAGDLMEVDGAGLSDEVIERVEEAAKQLGKSRRKRPVPKGWSSVDDIQQFEPTASAGFKPDKPLDTCAALAETSADSESPLVLYGSESGLAYIYSTDDSSAAHLMDCGSRVTDGLFWESKAIFSLANGHIKIFESGDWIATQTIHAGPATGIALHPTGTILASVGLDKSYVLYDLTSSTLKPLARVFTDSELTCCQFHPDGALLAAGAKNGDIQVFDIKTGSIVTSLTTEGPVQALSFAENGFWLASASTGSTNATIWDLRKTGTEQAIAKVIEFGSIISSLSWDHSAQYLAIVGGGSVAIETYQKSSKKWSEVMKKALNARQVSWDPQGQYLLVDGDGVVQLQKPE